MAVLRVFPTEWILSRASAQKLGTLAFIAFLGKQEKSHGHIIKGPTGVPGVLLTKCGLLLAHRGPVM